MADNKKSSINTKSTAHLLNIKQPARVGKRLKLSFRRTKATISVLKTGKSIDASLGLIDLSETNAGLFTQELLSKGSTVEVCITEPRLLKVKAVVAWSIPVKSGVDNARHAFRSSLQFVFENETQRAAVLEYIQSVNTDPIENVKNALAALPAAGLAPETPGPNVAFLEKPAEGAAPVAEVGAAPVTVAEAGETPAPLAEAPKPVEEAKPAEAAVSAAEEPKAA